MVCRDGDNEHELYVEGRKQFIWSVGTETKSMCREINRPARHGDDEQSGTKIQNKNWWDGDTKQELVGRRYKTRTGGTEKK